MELIRDLLRDLVGIIIPGSLLILFFLFLIFGFVIPFIVAPDPNAAGVPNGFAFLDSSGGVTIIVIFSYIAGQYLRLRRLDDLEEECTQKYRKEHKSHLDSQAFNASIKTIKAKEARIRPNKFPDAKLEKAYKEHMETFGLWERFPYPYILKGRRMRSKSENYNNFFEKYEKQIINEHSGFFNFCKRIIYEFSPSIKEELIRQESLVRLFAGVYHVAQIGILICILLIVVHLVVIATNLSRPFSLFTYDYINLSWIILVVSILFIFTLRFLNNEILNRLRFMRVKELQIAYDGFYAVSKRYDLDL